MRSPALKHITYNTLKADFFRNARALNIPLGAAEILSEETANNLMHWVNQRSAVTEEDINRQAAKILQKYNSDLAYVYKNRGKVI